jgi:serine/threonine-protein kinase
VNTERWRAIQRVFFQALEREGAARERYLDEACGDDTELRREVESLLTADETGGEILDADLDDLSLLLDDDAPADAPAQAGPYRILGEIGRGGMGVVYRAERDDEQYSRQVALKVVGAPGVSAAELAARFERERRILARLEHPNIARLYDAGVTSDGRSWLSMELVRGERIDRWCDHRRLTVAQRLELFERVVQAVDYAHRNLVVHRDLKPSNILVTDEGEPKLLDFGIARVLADEDEAAAEGELTRAGQRVLTPEYASPEQHDDRPITTASDVYSLGVLLHRLLTGRRPATNPATHETTRSPSGTLSGSSGVDDTPDPEAVARARSTTPHRLQRTLRGELDTILLAALRAEPEERYPSAAALLDDLKRYRTARPLLARPPSAGYRLRKFVGRNRAAVAAAAAVVVALVTGLGVSLRQAQIARAERDVAESVTAFLEGLFDAGNPMRPERLDTLPVSAFLERAVERLDTALADQPVVRARMQQTLGAVHENLGLHDAARPLLNEAIATYTELNGSRSPEVGDALEALGRSALASGNPAEAEEHLRRAIEIALVHEGEASRTLSMRRQMLVGPLLELDRLAEAEAVLEAALDPELGVGGEESRDVANSLNLLASLQYRQGKLDEAIPTMRAALDMTRRVLGDAHPQAAILSQNLGLVLLRAGRPDDAAPLVEASLRGLRAGFGPDYPQLGATAKTLANIMDALDRWPEADSLFEWSLAHSRRTVGDESSDVATVLHDYGMALAARGYHDDALPLLDEALGTHRLVSGPESAPVGTTLAALASLHRRRGEAARAQERYLESIDILTRSLPAEHPRVLEVRGGLALTRLALGDAVAAGDSLGLLYETASAVDDGGMAARGLAGRLADYHEALGDSTEAARWRAEAEGGGG